MIRNVTLFTTLVLFGAASLKAQQSIGLQSGNFSTPYSAFLNPANTYSGKSRLYLNFYSPTMGYTTNGFNYNFPVNPFRLNNRNFGNTHSNANGNLDFSNAFLQLNNVDNAKGFLLNENYGPSIFFRANRYNAFGFGVKSIAGASFNGINASTAKLMRFGSDTSGGAFSGTNALNQNQWYTNGKFGVDALSYQEWFLSWAHVAKDQNNSFWKVGATLKGIVANGHAGLHASNVEYRVNSANQLELKNTDLSFTHTGDNTASKIMQDPFGLNFSEASGGGAGIDLGFVYENRPNPDRKTTSHRGPMGCDDEEANEYNWKFGASLTDLGFIAFDGSNSTLSNSSNVAAWNHNSSLLDQAAFSQTPFDRFERVDQGFMRQLGATEKTGYSVFTPAALNAELDVKLKKGYYVAANWTQNLVSKNARGLKRNSYLAVTPRFESESFEVGLPLSLNQNYSRFNVGAYARFGPFVLGSDNLAGLGKVLSNAEHSSGNLYFGTRFKIKTCNFGTRQRHEKPVEWRPKEEVTEDTVFWRDTTIMRDSTEIIRTDTVYRIIRDTVFTTPKDNKEDIKRENELKEREEDLRKREKEVRDRELEVTRRESQVGTSGGGTNNRCCTDLVVVKRERDNLSRENRTLRDRINRYELDIDNYKRRITNLEADVTRYRRAANECEDKIDNSTREINRLKEELARCKMSSDNNPCAAQTKSLDSLLQIEKDRRRKAEAEVVKMKREKTNSEEELRRTKSEYEVLKKTNDDLVKRWGENGTCCESLSKVQKENDDLKKQLGELSKAKARIVDLEKEVATLKRKLTEEVNKPKGSDCSVEKSKITALEKEIANLKRKLSEEMSKDKGSDCATEKAKIVSLEKELANIKKLLNTEISKSKGLEDQLEDCKKNAGSSSEAEVLKLKKTIEEKDQIIKSKDAEIGSLNATLKTKDAKIKSLEAELTACKAQGTKDCSKCEDELRQLKMDFEGCKNQKAALQAEYDYLLKDRNNWKAKFEKCEKDLAGAGTGDTKKIEELEAKITILNRTIATLNSEINSKNESIKALQASYDKLNNEKKGLEAENAKLKAEVQTLKSSLNALTAERNDLRTKLEACQNKGGEGNSSPTGRAEKKGETVGRILGSIFSAAIEGAAKTGTAETPKTGTNNKPKVRVNTNPPPVKVQVPNNSKPKVQVKNGGTNKPASAGDKANSRTSGNPIPQVKPIDN